MNATFFDGKVSRANPATVTLTGDNILISYTDATGQAHSVEWPVAAARLSTWSPNGKTRLQFGEFPHQYLDILTDNYQTRFLTNKHLLKAARPGLYEIMLSKGFRGIVITGLAIIALIWALYAYVIPAASVQLARQVSTDQELYLGEVIYKQLESTGQLQRQEAKSKLIGQFWQDMALRTRVPVYITVVDSKEENAFAVPGGRIVVFTGILKRLKRPEQLAALLAHEAAHIENRHSLQQMIRSVATYSIVALLAGDINGLTAVIAENADNLVSLSYSRQHEEEADAFAVTELARHGINPLGTVWLMEALPANGETIPTLLRSHPHNAERIATTRRLAQRSVCRPCRSLEHSKAWITLKEQRIVSAF